ncbi:hypothetical protein GF312_15875, partial [Candidatus Poribacteria bacterium]|nr:hypothetical protein [Candidatus Poribacteria bacterium]
YKDDNPPDTPDPDCLESVMVSTKLLTENVDPCGCGDTFFAVLSSCIMAGYGVEESMKTANSGARSVARKMYGAHCTTISEIGYEYEELYLAGM